MKKSSVGRFSEQPPPSVSVNINYEVSILLQLLPSSLILAYLIIGLVKGFSKSWTIVSTAAALILAIVPLINAETIKKRNLAKKQLQDSISTKASSIERKKD